MHYKELGTETQSQKAYLFPQTSQCTWLIDLLISPLTTTCHLVTPPVMGSFLRLSHEWALITTSDCLNEEIISSVNFEYPRLLWSPTTDGLCFLCRCRFQAVESNVHQTTTTTTNNHQAVATNGNGHHHYQQQSTKSKEASSYEQEHFEQINSKYVSHSEQIHETYKATNGSSSSVYKFHSVNLEKLPLPSTGGNVVGEWKQRVLRLNFILFSVDAWWFRICCRNLDYSCFCPLHC